MRQPVLAPDYSKAIGIFLVVLGHCLRGLMDAGILPETAGWLALDKAIYLFHMPLFFYVSGMFFEGVASRYTVASALKRYSLLLLVPLVFWAYLQTGLQYALAGGATNSTTSLHDLIFAPAPPKQQFWFLGVLFALFVFAFIALRLRAKWLMGAAMLACFAMTLAYGRSELIHHFTATEGAETGSHWLGLLALLVIHAPFFFAGILLPPQRLCLSSFPLLLAVAAVAVIVGAYLMEECSLLLVALQQTLGALAVILALYRLCQWLEEHAPPQHWLALLGMNSMIIYLAHIIASAGVRVVLLRLGFESAGLHLALGVAIGLLAPLGLLLAYPLAGYAHWPILLQSALPLRRKR